jgi:hypothetical protein
VHNIRVASADGAHSGDLLFTSLPELTARNVDEAADVLTRVFLPAKVDAIGMTRLDLRMNVVQLPALTAGHVRFGANVDIQIDEVSDYYIDIPLTGQAVNRWRDGQLEKTSAGSAAVSSPGTPCDLGTQPLVFSRRMDLKNAGSSGWFDLVRLLARDAGRSDGLLAHRLAQENLQR